MKLICIQTCSDWNNNRICVEGRDYIYREDLSTNKAVWVTKDNLQFYGLFERENFITLAEYRERQINSILE